MVICLQKISKPLTDGSNMFSVLMWGKDDSGRQQLLTKFECVTEADADELIQSLMLSIMDNSLEIVQVW